MSNSIANVCLGGNSALIYHIFYHDASKPYAKPRKKNKQTKNKTYQNTS